MPRRDVQPDDILSLTLNERLIPLFYQLLGHGFSMAVQTGISVKELLCDQLGINENYLEERIKSIFLNGKVVDDVNTAIVEDNATMALSGAMPGLVGAILRTGGYYAPMRGQISYDKSSGESQLKKGKVTLKLWNLVVKELGPIFLQRGVFIQKKELQAFIQRNRETLMTGCRSAEMTGKAITPDQLQDLNLTSDPIYLQVNPADSK